jgi:hypothetical protein
MTLSAETQAFMYGQRATVMMTSHDQDDLMDVSDAQIAFAVFEVLWGQF